ncbi:hypothetical protein [Sphingomonas sp.]|uniref:hypothetical protein n=1 Tax=Sphingomonas sp. TaxID=28214 RepID=UPI002BE6B3DA|nr:hypothetical protein [Sphingomonas sp.]HTG39719.1 hypothetical protein [Sphingomonas sp.]
MGWGREAFILAIIALSMGTWAFTNWLRAKHGYPMTDDNGETVHKGAGPDAERKIALLTTENERLTGQIGRLEERIAVLERIATDPAERLNRDIDALR